MLGGEEAELNQQFEDQLYGDLHGDWSHISENTKRLMLRLLQWNPASRPSLQNVLDHHFTVDISRASWRSARSRFGQICVVKRRRYDDSDESPSPRNEERIRVKSVSPGQAPGEAYERYLQSSGYGPSGRRYAMCENFEPNMYAAAARIRESVLMRRAMRQHARRNLLQ